MKLNKYLAAVQIVAIVLIGLFSLNSNRKSESVVVESPPPAGNPRLLSFVRSAGIIHYGESLWDIFRKNRIVDADIPPAISEFKKICDPRDIQVGAHYKLVQDSLNRLVSYEYQPDITTIYKIKKDSSGLFSGTIENQPLVKKIKTISGTISSTLYQSIMDKGETPELIVNFTDIFQWDIDFFIEPQVGDSYKMVYEAYYLNERFVKYGRVLAAQYCLSGKTFTAFYYDNQLGKGGYYDWNGQSFQKTFLKSPLNYRRISSYFSLGRMHPILKRIRPHYGVDFAAPSGTPVVAPADGVVIEMGYQKGGVGRYLKIHHTNTHFVTLYGHLKAYARGIKKGVAVKQRRVIGYVGMTGLATGPHLHYTFYENGRPINPLRINNISADPLKPEQVVPFQHDMMPLLAKLAEIEDNKYAWSGVLY